MMASEWPFELLAADEVVLRELTMSYPGGAEAWATQMRRIHETSPSQAAVELMAERARLGTRGDRSKRVLLLEAPADEREIEDMPFTEVVQGSLSEFADADEVFVFRGEEATAGKHRDRALEDVHVVIHRREGEQ